MKRILLVEDDTDISEALSLYLSFKGYAVTTCAKVEGYKTYVDTIKDVHPDLIISDIFIPNIDGRELCRFVKDHYEFSSIPYLLISAGSFSREEVLACKGDEFIPKPFDVSVLEQTIHRMIQ